MLLEVSLVGGISCTAWATLSFLSSSWEDDDVSAVPLVAVLLLVKTFRLLPLDERRSGILSTRVWLRIC